jgi:cytochrome c-type biogenesis protein CcmH/NrfG
MPNEAAQQGSDAVAWQSKQVYVMAAVCLVIGLAIGYLLRGSRSTASALPDTRQASGPASGMAGGMRGEMPSLEQMKHMSDMNAAPLLEKLKSDPKNSSLLIQVGSIYQAAHQFKEAAAYYDKALKIDPKNVALRTEFASCLYYNGRVDEAIQQLNQSLHYSQNDATSLFNLGAMKWKEKHDAAGALADWQQLLKTNPQLGADKKANVEQLIQEAKQHIAGDTERGPAFAGPVNGAKTQ